MISVAMHLKNIEAMYRVVDEGEGFAVIVVVSPTRAQAELWQRRLEGSQGTIVGKRSRIFSLEEDWPGGAGQLLGTLYAWRKLEAQGLDDLLSRGGTIAIYHTAGKGMRLSPLPLAEGGNKSAVKLPRLIRVNGQETPLTLLEAVIFQTQIFAPSRRGRLCVFWGDQIFIPERSPDFTGGCQAEIFDIRQELPEDKEEWIRNWQSYGLLIPAQDGEVLQREKQTWDEIGQIKEKGIVRPGPSGKIILGKSLGSFSISQTFLQSLLEEFRPELERKRGRLDTDPHLWMPLSSSCDDFELGGGDPALWERINRLKLRLLAQESKPRLIVDKDLGEKTFWWDFGQIRFYYENLLRILEDSYEGKCLRKFFDLEKNWVKHFRSEELNIENSVLVDSQVTGEVKDSLLFRVKCDRLRSSHSVLFESFFSRAEVDKALTYNCFELENLTLKPGEVRSDTLLPQGRVTVKTKLERDGKKDWSERLQGNFYCYGELGEISGEAAESLPQEKERWQEYHRHRENIRESIKRLKKAFIKPRVDNLVEVVWGGNYIEKLKRLPSSGKKIGESWECSAHPQHPSMIEVGENLEIPLPHLLSLLGEEALGPAIAREFKGGLPVLVKFIDARQDLSVQVHPSDEKARELGEIQSGKNEAWLILEAGKESALYLGFKEEVNQEQFEKDLSSPEANIAEKYLNAIPAGKGDIFFNPAGTIHAIGKGLVLVEIQQTSGITYRVWDWNRQPPRPLHIQKALKALNFKRSTPEDFRRYPQRVNESEERLISSLYFSVNRLNLRPGEQLILETKGSFQVLTCIKGRVKLESKNSVEELSCGESLLVPASLGHYRLTSLDQTQLLKSFVLSPEQINPVIFQTYDVRAIADVDLTDRVVYYLGKGYGTYLRRINRAPSGKLWVIVGGGVRLSTERIRQVLIKGLRSSGVNVYDIGLSSTPELYFAIPYLDADGGINITASHNEAEYNGLKQVVKDKDGFITSINAQQMLELKTIILSGDFLDGEGEKVKIEEGEIARYHNELVKANLRLGRDIWVYLKERWKNRGLRPLLDKISSIDFPERMSPRSWEHIRNLLEIPPDFEPPELAIKHPLQRLKLVIDFGNGSTWRTKQVYLDLGAEVVALNEKPDGSFPAHIPDPIKARYRQQLEEKVKEVAGEEEEKARAIPGYIKKEVVGFGHDEDGDRVIYVRSDGKVVEGDRTLAIQAKQIIEEHYRKGRPGKPRFMGEVKFSRVADEFITQHGGEYIMNPTGFAFIKEGAKRLYQAVKKGLPEVELFGRKIDLSQNKETIALAAELSGHQMSGHEENWIFDDGTLAAAKILGVIARALNKGRSFIELDEEVPRYPVSPEINLKLPTNVLAEKQEVVEQVVRIFQQKGYSIDTTDGGLIRWLDTRGEWLGQALVRKSNTQPMIICRVEGRDEQSKARIEEEFFQALAQVSTKAVPKLDLTSDDYARHLLAELKQAKLEHGD